MSWLQNVFALPWWWWIAGVALMGLELLVPGVFLLWLGLGAVATGVVLWLLPDLPLAWQVLALVLLMFASLAAGARWQRQDHRDGPRLNDELQALVGQRLTSITDFEHGRGRVRVGDSSYAAVADGPLLAGELVEVWAVEGTTLKVRRPASP